MRSFATCSRGWENGCSKAVMQGVDTNSQGAAACLSQAYGRSLFHLSSERRSQGNMHGEFLNSWTSRLSSRLSPGCSWASHPILGHSDLGHPCLRVFWHPGSSCVLQWPGSSSVGIGPRHLLWDSCIEGSGRLLSLIQHAWKSFLACCWQCLLTSALGCKKLRCTPPASSLSVW